MRRALLIVFAVTALAAAFPSAAHAQSGASACMLSSQYYEICVPLEKCYVVGGVWLFLPPRDAEAELRRCSILDRRYVLHWHDEGVHARPRRRVLRRSKAFSRLYRVAQQLVRESSS